jgi:hypothetical protein
LTHRKVRPKAIELFESGWHPADIARNLEVSLRTVQRWIADFKENRDVNSSESPESLSGGSITVSPEAIYYPSKSWVNSAQILAGDHLDTHENIRRTMTSLLNNELQNGGENLRAIDKLSLAIARHTEAERQAASLHLLDVNRAAELLQNYGFIVSRPENESEDSGG